MTYYTYSLRCENGSFYTGITTDPARRFLEHSRQKSGGAKATGISRPVCMEAVWSSGSRAEASRLEYRIKRLTHAQKRSLIDGEAPLPLEGGDHERVNVDGEGHFI